MTNNRSVLVLLLAAALTTACDENAVKEIAGPPPGGASVKFFNFSPSSPNVLFYSGDLKVTAASSTTCGILTDANREQCTTTGAEATTGIAYGSSANSANAWYSDLEPGQHALNARIRSSVDTLRGVQVANVQTTLEDGKFYSYYLSGVYDAGTKTADAFIIEDVIPAIDYSTAHVRFVNAISNGTGPLTLYIKDRDTQVEVPIGNETAYRSGTAFVPVPNAAYDLSVRYTGSATNVILRTNVTFALGRVYTITARGNTATASTMALDNTANR